MRTLILGDPHGGYKAMLQCFDRADFDYKNDRLIVLGDVCDGWSQVKECIDELLKVKNLDYILGNHDEWALEWGKSQGTWEDEIWTSQGGQQTIDSYGYEGMLDSHIKLLEEAKLYILENNKLFTHGGIIPLRALEKTHKDVFLWDRDLINTAAKKHTRWEWKCKKEETELPRPQITPFDEVFVGHTSTMLRSLGNTDKPVHYCEVWCLDQGGGWGGKLTLMSLDTKEYWQSDTVRDLYPDDKRR